MQNNDNHLVLKTACRDNPDYLESMDYRGCHVDFYWNQKDNFIYAEVDGTKIDLGSNTCSYKEDVEYLINKRLDFISDFKFPGMKLTYFQNGKYRDIGLYYKNRLLKVWLLQNNTASEEQLAQIIRDAQNIISTIITAKSKSGNIV